MKTECPRRAARWLFLPPFDLDSSTYNRLSILIHDASGDDAASR
jgi:hypothetical protein